MNAYARRFPSEGLQLGALCLAIGIALALPMAALAQEVSQDDATAPDETAAAQDDSAPPAEHGKRDPFSLENSDDPAKLKDLIQTHNTIEFGFNYVSDDSFRFGRYTGLNDQGVSGLFNLDVLHRGAYNSDSADYWSFRVSNLGLDSREAAFELGRQGKFRVRVDYDQIPIFRSDSARTIFDGAGSNNLTLPSNWVGGSNTAGMTQLLADLKPVELKTERHRTGVSVSGVLSRNWGFSASYKHEDKEGTKSIGGGFGNSGGNPRAAILPEPVDYLTQEIETTLRYSNGKLQVEASYYLSLFSDRNNALSWSNPYTAISGWDASAGFPGGQGQLALPPDNRFQQFSLDAGYNISDRTRISASVARGRMTQNDAFLPYTDIPALAASITQPLPRDSLNGKIDTTVVNLRIASRPWDNFSWNAAYRYDNRDNKTPRDEYVYIGGDSQTQDTSLTSSHRRFNEPYSYKEEQFKADASWRMFGHTDLIFGAQHSKIDRTYSERERADEDTYNIGLNSEISERFSGHFRYTHAQRDGSTYFGNHPLHEGFSEDYVATVPGDFENLPGLRKYFLANRDRDQVSWLASFTPNEAWTLGASVDYARDDYNKSELGLVGAKIGSLSLDAVYAPSPLWSVYANFTREKLSSDQNGHSFSGGGSVLSQAFDPTRDWFVAHRDRVNSFAAGYKRSMADNRLDFGVDYLYSRTHSDLDFAVGPSLLTAPLPSTVSELNSLDISGTYKIDDKWSMRMDLWYERFHSTDWAVDGITENTLANVILLGEDSPDYHVYVVSLSFLYRF